jgi:predicted ATPase
VEYQWIERARKELSAFRAYYLDPRVAMRQAAPPKEVTDIGPLGENLAPFLYRLRSSEEHKRYFDAVVRTLRSIIPSVESLAVDLDEKRGTLDIQIVQGGVTFSSRIVSEGTLRVLALAALAANPWPGSLVAFEEPENGVHPRRLELVARLLGSLAIEQGLQVIVTTHSPLFCQQILAIQREQPKKVALLALRQEGGKTQCFPFEPRGPLFEDHEVRAALTSQQEDGWFEGLVLRGLVDG